MSWRQIVAQALRNWPEHERQRGMLEVATENDTAERAGFTCHLDDNRGYGYCYFTNGNIRVWNSADGWCRSISQPSGVKHREREFYHTLGQALTATNPFMTCDAFGNRTTIAPAT